MKATRREFLRGLHAATTLGAFPLLPALAAGSTAVGRSRRPLLVVIFLRGGIDGMNLVVPHAEESYYALRPGIAIPRPAARSGCLDLDGYFGLHPRAKPLLDHFEQGHALCLQGVGSAKNTRSHFEEQDYWETCVSANDAATDGWLNRHLAAVEGNGPLRAVALSSSMPRLLRGRVPTLAIRKLSDISGGGDEGAMMQRALAAGSGRRSELWSENARATLELLEELQALEAHRIPSRVEYPRTSLARHLSEIARLRRARVGLEVAAVDFGGWDTHRAQGGLEGSFADKVAQLAAAIDAFLRDLEDELEEVLVLTLSEFGRTAFENGTGGTDHGQGNMSLVFGGALRADRPVVGEWPGLTGEQLNRGRDLRVTVDFRQVIGEVLGGYLGSPDPAGLLGLDELRSVGFL